MTEKNEDSSKRTGQINLVIITFAHMFNHTFMRMHQALVPIFRSELNLDWFTVSLMSSIPLTFQALMSIPSGMLADRFNHRYLVSISIILCAIAAVMVSQAQSVYLLIISLSILAFSSTFYHPAAFSFTSELFDVSQRNRALGIHGAGGTFGTSIGPITLGLLMTYIGWRNVYLLWAVPISIFAFLVFTKLKTKTFRRHEKSEFANINNLEKSVSIKSVLSRELLILLSVIGISSFGTQALSPYMTSYFSDVRGMPIGLSTILFGLVSTMGLLSAPIGGYFADKLGEKKWLTITFIGILLTISGVALSSSIYLLTIFYLLNGFFQFAGMAANSSLVARFTPKSRRGLGYGLFFLPTNLVGSVSPLVSSVIVSNFGIWYVFPLAFGIYLVATLLLQAMPTK
jgi:FSR family fosmidomycin resistance protein-like MFS transporter